MGCLNNKIMNDDDEVPTKKIVLLGSGATGKSTLFKQVMLHYGKGFSEEFYNEAKFAIIRHMTYIMLVLLRVGSGKGLIALTTEIKVWFNALEEIYVELKKDAIDNDAIPKLRTVIPSLWDMPQIRVLLVAEKSGDSNDFVVGDLDWAQYFLESWDRILRPSYHPTQDDIMRMRRETTEIRRINFKYLKSQFTLVDVGGQAHTRIEWESQYTSDLIGAIYLVSLSDYEVLHQDATVSWSKKIKKLFHSLQVYSMIFNDPRLNNVPITLVLNKNDIFKEKIKTIGLSVCFPDCKKTMEENNYDAALQYIINEFKLKTPESRQFHVHVTCATDTLFIKNVINSIMDLIIQANLTTQGFSITDQ